MMQKILIQNLNKSHPTKMDSMENISSSTKVQMVMDIKQMELNHLLQLLSMKSNFLMIIVSNKLNLISQMIILLANGQVKFKLKNLVDTPSLPDLMMDPDFGLTEKK